MLKWSAIFLIYFYRYCISTIKPCCCIYKQTCSAYALEMFKTKSFFIAFYLTIKRILSCHPMKKLDTFR